MNERIQQLWEEATVSTWPRPGKFTAGEYDYHLKKFAELIVKECEKIIRAEIAVTDIDGESERAWEMGMECGVYTIKKHFGVEE
jgi:hypothetical protein